MSASVGSCRMKLQLLHPIAGVSPTPLASALAGAAGPAVTVVTAIRAANGTVTRRAVRIRIHRRMLITTTHCRTTANRSGQYLTYGELHPAPAGIPPARPAR